MGIGKAHSLRCQPVKVRRGNLAPVLRRLEGLMDSASAAYEFEQAEFYRKRIEQVKAYKRRSTVVSEKIRNLEVLTVLKEQHLAVVNHFKVENGSIIHQVCIFFNKQSRE